MNLNNNAMLQKRIDLYNEVRYNCDVDKDYGVYFDIKLSSSIFEELKTITTKYIAKALRVTYPEQDFIIDDDFLVTYERQILALPSRTPNGAFHPKKENAAEYNELQKSIVSALEQTGFLSNCLAVQPCTVRIMCGKQKDLDHTRPLATTKLHSDSWASHVGDAIMGCPLLGDTTTSLEFYKPQGIGNDFFLPLENYDDGLRKFKNKTFLGCARLGHISVFDHACLHRTSLNGGGIRVSFDFGIIMDNPNSLYYDALKRENTSLEVYRYEYLDVDVYKKLGKELLISVDETMQEAKSKYLMDDPGSYQRAPIKIVER